MIDALDEMLAPHLFPPSKPTAAIRATARSAETAGLGLKLGRFGAFIGCSNYPECRYTRQLSRRTATATAAARASSARIPETGLEVTVRSGRFGSYRAARRSGSGRPRSPSAPACRRASSPDDIDLERALKLLRLPREVGAHPEDGEPIMAGIGRFGPYVQHGKTYANLEPTKTSSTIGLNRAVTLIAEKKRQRPARAAASAPTPAARRRAPAQRAA